MTQSGVAVEYVEKVDPVQELKTIPGVDASAVEDFAVDAKEAEAATREYEQAAAAAPPPGVLQVEGPVKSPAGVERVSRSGASPRSRRTRCC